MAIGASEAETFWTEFLRSLARRGLRGVKLVIFRRPQGPEGRRDPDPRRHLAKMPRALRPHLLAHAGRQGRRVVSAFVATAFAQEDADSAKVSGAKSPTSSGPRCPSWPFSWTKPSTTSSPT